MKLRCGVTEIDLGGGASERDAHSREAARRSDRLAYHLHRFSVLATSSRPSGPLMLVIYQTTFALYPHSLELF